MDEVTIVLENRRHRRLEILKLAVSHARGLDEAKAWEAWVQDGEAEKPE